MTKEKCYVANVGILESWEEYEYNSDNKIMNSLFYENGDGLDTYQTYEYGSNSLLQKLYYYDAPDYFDGYCIYKYNSKGDLIRENEYKCTNTCPAYSSISVTIKMRSWTNPW